ncbi:hypothetical protein NQ317_017341 [Molorchus minor]|uniref:Uncharacterized protein n=1 Tax=Molorchus minor TaxID=1323400 RepID=A0ABQ9J5D5_9CUCU|nr:hypothetical protein NQ317_017341 [Molorchus minor]
MNVQCVVVKAATDYRISLIPDPVFSRAKTILCIINEGQGISNMVEVKDDFITIGQQIADPNKSVQQ